MTAKKVKRKKATFKKRPAKLKVEYVDIDKLKPWEKNPRKNDEAVDSIVRSIEKFGYTNPVLVRRKDNRILAGHTRLKALKKIGMTKVPVIFLDLGPEQADLYALFDNKSTENTPWDIPKLSDLFVDLKEVGANLELTGFSPDEIANMWGDDVKEGLTDDDEIPEVPEKPKTKTGDLYILGEHRLLCGDSTKAEDVERLMDGQKADMVFTDPPYGVEFQSNMRTKSKKFDKLTNDEKIITSWIETAMLHSIGWILFCTSWKVLSKWLEAGKRIGDLSNMIIWDKGGGGIGDLEHSLSTDYEIILAYNRGNKIIGKRIGSVWSIGKDNPNIYTHPTQKPVELASLALITFNKDIVLDPFLGSGSTMIACEKLGRRCFGMEIDEHYCDVIVKRWEDFTGKKARLQADSLKKRSKAGKRGITGRKLKKKS